MERQAEKPAKGKPVANRFLRHRIPQAIPLLQLQYLEQHHRRIGRAAVLGILERLAQGLPKTPPIQFTVDPIQHTRFVLSATPPNPIVRSPCRSSPSPWLVKRFPRLHSFHRLNAGGFAEVSVCISGNIMENIIGG